MKRYIPFLLFCAVELAVCMLPIPYLAKLLLCLLGIALYFWYRRNVFCYLHGMSLLRKGRTDAALTWFGRAVKAGLDDTNRLTVANLYVLYGDQAEAARILDGLSARKTGDAPLERMLQAMVRWRDGDLDEALRLMEAVKESGYRSATLTSNLMIMHLARRDAGKAEQLWKEADDDMRHDIGLADVHGRLLIVQGKWNEAYKVYDALLKRSPHLVDEYVHACLVFVHFGMVKEALLCLGEAKTGPFTKVCPFDLPFITTLSDRLQDPETRLATAHALDSHAEEVTLGRLPAPDGTRYGRSEGDRMEGFAALPKQGGKAKAELDASLPDTDLNESDEVYLATHKELGDD